MGSQELFLAGQWWLTPVILATQEIESKRIKVQSQPPQIVQETPSQRNPSQKRVGGVTQGVGPEFKLQYHKKKKELFPLAHLNTSSSQFQPPK
jgi:hypothetical protein